MSNNPNRASHATQSTSNFPNVDFTNRRQEQSVQRFDKRKGRAKVSPIGDDTMRPTKKRKLAKSQERREAAIVYYKAPQPAQETVLYLKLREMDSEGHLTRYFKWARKLSSELGPCAADLLWRQVFIGPSSEARTESHNFGNYKKVVEQWTFDMPDANLTSRRCNVSPQFTKLLDVLRSCDMGKDSFCGIIHAKRPVTTLILVELLQAVHDDFPDIRPVALTSSNPLGSPQNEVNVMKSLAAGKYNLLITNKLPGRNKIQHATVLIHFDLTEIGSGAMTPGPINDSIDVVYMAERDNGHHQELVQAYLEHASFLEHQALLPASSTQEELPSHSLDDFVEDPTTGKRIYPKDAVVALSLYMDYLGDLSREKAVHAPPLYNLQRSNGGDDVLRLVFPEEEPLPEPLRELAECSPDGATTRACFSSCRKLFEQGFLDYRFFVSPAPTKSSEVDSGDIRAANVSANTRCYPRRRPSFWVRSLQSGLTCLHPLVVSVGSFRHGFHAPMVILCRLPMPKLDSFSVFSNGEKATVHLVSGAPFSVTERNRDLFFAYTARVARALVNKPLECRVDNLLYFFAPLETSWDTSTSMSIAPWQLPDVESHIAWHEMEEARDHWAIPLLSEHQVIADGSYRDCVIQDRAVEFTNRHFVTKLRQDLTPLSKPEPQSREVKSESYLDFCKEHRKDFQGLRDEKQPLIEVLLIPPVVNNLSPTSKANPGSAKSSSKLLIPELCYKFVIPASTFRTALLLPSITRMIDCMLLTKEMSVNIFESKVKEEHLLEAVTPAVAQVEHNYERLELLGDTLLKNIMSTYYFVTMPGKREGSLNGARAQAVCNKALHINALAAGIPPWVQSKPLLPRLWVPYLPDTKLVPRGGDKEGKMDVDQPGGGKQQQGSKRSKQQKQQDELEVQWLGDKTVADVVEALIGAAFHNGGTETVLQVMRILCFNMPKIKSYPDFWKIYAPHLTPAKATHGLSVQTIEAVKSITGYEFPEPSILAEALTHGSVTAGNNATSYDRLEFLGDSVLDVNVVWYIFTTHPNLSPGGLSLLKAAMVSNQTLATVAVLTGLHEYIRCSSPDVQSAIKLYAHKILLLRDQEQKLADVQHRLPIQFWLEVEAPKALGDLVEAIIAAIYVSDRFETQGVEAFFDKVLKPFYDRHIRIHTLAHHPSKSLFGLLQAEGCQQHGMRKRPEEDGILTEVVLHDVVLAGAIDTTANASMRRAAVAALDALADDPGFLARNCDCKAQRSGNKTQKPEARQAGYEVD